MRTRFLDPSEIGCLVSSLKIANENHPNYLYREALRRLELEACLDYGGEEIPSMDTTFEREK